MKKVIITYGLIAGAIVTALMYINFSLSGEEMDFDLGEILGYLTMIISLSTIFFGIKTFRDKHNEGIVSFGKAFRIGLFITLIAACMYAIGWEVYYQTSASDFMTKYTAHYIEKLESSGASAEEIEQKAQEMKVMQEYYANPFIRFAWTIMEIFPIGLVISLVSAAILRKKEVLPAH
ncbi:hypothetical protein C900_00554 [Fulvivirga imtechensis AK7]|uniref:DUF4199 domain-containing protein n=1 Tax=Fulvivirga imtechensis AK7 TaxID=1237149 RepID=L8JHL3_9BACT|nr:DUF4199 domain-containing protein [Fulvivirga imtechensis]ELR68290.1 hypothetical protein C900_00554 [Fulvivirga imtechensis AK7]